MNVVDIGILIIIGLFAVGGLRRGFLLGVIDLVTFGLALVVAARFAPSLAGPLRNLGVPSDLAAGAAFILGTVISLAAIGLVARILVAPLGAMTSATPLGWANSVLGLLPGAIRGLAITALLVLLLSEFPPRFGVREYLAYSRLADPIATAGRQALDTGLAWAGIDLQALGMPYQGANTTLEFAGS